ELPSGDWHCIFCCCKFCGLFAENKKQNTIYNRNYGCVLLTYHETCLEANNDETIHFNRASVCGKTCQEIFERFEILLRGKHDVGNGFYVTLFCKSHDIGWSGSKIDMALSIMYECFQPTFVNHNGNQIDMIPNILSSSWSSSLAINYAGFFTVLLEEGGHAISVATVRIHENQYAEMPFIGTRFMYRKRGMCHRLMNAIELMLSYLNVEMLIIPSAQEVLHTWISCFGFEPLDMTTKNLIKNKNVVKFFGVEMLQKRISNV
ncbi:hypothetical protein RYX36_031196, partial [Vicia faba]